MCVSPLFIGREREALSGTKLTHIIANVQTNKHKEIEVPPTLETCAQRQRDTTSRKEKILQEQIRRLLTALFKHAHTHTHTLIQ